MSNSYPYFKLFHLVFEASRGYRGSQKYLNKTWLPYTYCPKNLNHLSRQQLGHQSTNVRTTCQNFQQTKKNRAYFHNYKYLQSSGTHIPVHVTTITLCHTSNKKLETTKRLTVPDFQNATSDNRVWDKRGSLRPFVRPPEPIRNSSARKGQ